MLRAAALFGASVVAGGLLQSSQSVEQRVECAKAAVSSPFSPDAFKGFKLISSSLPVASCVVCKFTDSDGKDVTRPYTPITDNGTKGRFELIIKKYPKSKMGTHVFQLRTGEELLMKGPFVKFEYSPNMWSHVGMICGGTGIAPMYQVIRSIVTNPKDKTNVSLIYANNARRDILLANELTEMQKTYPNFNMYLTLLDVPQRWLGGIGFVNRAMVEAFMPKPGLKNSKILVCGPPGMMKALSGDKEYPAGKAPQQGPLSGLLKDMGYSEDQVFKF